MKQALSFLVCICLHAPSTFAQSSGIKVHTEDIDRFWIAYDSIRTTTDSLQQLHFIKILYTEKASPGLKAFMEVRNYTPELYVRLIRNYPKYWNTIRPNTLQVKTLEKQFDPGIQKFKKLYPGLKTAELYFLIGGMRSGGTTKDNLVLIGTEIATGNASVDLSDFPPNSRAWLSNIYQNQQLENIIPLNIHELVHTQQKLDAKNLLSQSILEGSCDFISYLVTGKTVDLPYRRYGPTHEAELKSRFAEQMFFSNYNVWLYNSRRMIDSVPGNLGYYMGYAICRSYYEKARNKKKAIREIIELNYSDVDAVETFLERSQYFGKRLARQTWLASAERKRPYVTAITPFNNGDTIVDASTQEITIYFSAAMDPGNYAVLLDLGGEEQYPLGKLKGFAPDGKSATFKLNLRPGQMYDCIVSRNDFSSADGYPLKTFPLRFRTKR